MLTNIATDVIIPLSKIVISGFLLWFVYGLYLLQSDRDTYRKKHGVDPWKHGWDLDKNEQNKNQ